MSLRGTLQQLARKVRRLRGRSDLGRFASSTPLSAKFGLDRGTPIDRFYIDRFFAENAAGIHGDVLEVVEPYYCRRFGSSRVTGEHVVDVDSSNPKATIIGDLGDPATLPDSSFDCIIVTQTLHLVFDIPAALAQLRRALRPGGTLLVTVPGITPVRPDKDYDWYWSLTEASLAKLLAAQFDSDKVEVRTFGNLFAATAFLHGAALEEVPKGKLDRLDPAFPVIVAARAAA